MFARGELTSIIDGLLRAEKMTRRQLADTIGVHPKTVSAAILRMRGRVHSLRNLLEADEARRANLTLARQALANRVRDDEEVVWVKRNADDVVAEAMANRDELTLAWMR